MTDPLSVPAIAERQREVEARIQAVPATIQDLDEALAKARIPLEQARAKAFAEVRLESPKSTAAERESMVFLRCKHEWFEYRKIEAQAEYARALSKALFAELSSLQSRLRAAVESSKAHGMVDYG